MPLLAGVADGGKERRTDELCDPGARMPWRCGEWIDGSTRR
jgi:hypothetical protein